MRQKKATSCSLILQNARLPILERAKKLQRLEQAVLQLMPADLAAHCTVMNLKNEILVLATTSSAWAARLRFAAPDLVKQLGCQHALNLRGIQVRIEPEISQIQEDKSHPPRLSMASGALLAQTAQTIKHPALQEALYRLAANARDI